MAAPDSDGSPLDPYAILSALGRISAADTWPVAGGRDTLLWRVETDDGHAALRLYRSDQQHVHLRERAVLQAARGAGLPVAEVLASGLWHDRPVLLLRWLSGETLLAAVARRPWRIWQLGLAFGRTQAAIHGVTAPAALLPADGWIAAAAPQDLQARLRAVSGPARLLHFDYHPLNVLCVGNRVSGVIDWTNASAGDPRADLARTETILRFEDFPSAVERAGATILRWAWWRGYATAAGPPVEMGPFRAWAALFMLGDRGPRQDRPGQLSAGNQARLRRWAARWQA